MTSMAEGRVKEVIVDSRINKVLAMRTDSVAMLEALDAISEFYVVNSVEARRALRQDLELQNINLARKFLSEFDQVREKIEDVENLSKKLETTCDVLAGRVAEADENMKAFMEKASELESRRNFYLEQSKEISNFLGRFQLSTAEVDIIYKSSIDKASSANSFFDALYRLRTAYIDCKAMVEKHHYSAGFELLDILGQHQDVAYQRLFEWVKGKCESLVEIRSTDETDIILQTAIRYLRKLPIYFSQCQDLVVNSRRAQLVQKFVVALTQGGPTGHVFRAIDLHSHDAVRYVGDMLAWMHQAVASEEEFLQAVFGDQSNSRNENQNNSNESHDIPLVEKSPDSENAALTGLSIPELLARSLQGLGRPLRVRIMQTLESRPSLETLYALCDLLTFYETTFNRIVSMENAVHSAVKGCLLECKRLFVTTLNKQAEALTHSPSSCPLDLTASHSTKECTRQIQEILRVCGSSLSSLPSDTADSCHIDAVLGSIIQPLLQACRLGGQSLPPGDMAIFILNNVSTIQHELKAAGKRNGQNTPLDTVNVTSTWLDLLNTEASTWAEVLVVEEANRTLRRSDLDKLLEMVQIIPQGVVASEQPGLDQERVGTIMQAFYASLFSTVTPQFDRLLDPELREMTRRQVAEAVATAHAKVYQVLSDSIHRYDVSVLAHTIDEVRVLLGCQ